MQRRSLALAAVVLGSGIVFLDSTVVNVALKAIGKDLSATFVTVLEGQSYIVNGYLLTLSALLILSGALADTYGRRLMFMIGLGGFGVTSIVCGLAPNMALLINAPLIVAALYLAWTAIDESKDPEATGHFDWLGAAAIAVAVGGLSFGGIRGQATRWADPLAFVSLGAGALVTIALVPLMTRRPRPLVPPSLFRSRNFTVTNISTMLIYGALYCYGSFQAIFLQGSLGYSALASGLVGVPTAIFLALISTQAGTLAARIGPRIFMTVGPALLGLGPPLPGRNPAASPSW